MSGIVRVCKHCGRAHVFSGKIEDRCEVCNERLTTVGLRYMKVVVSNTLDGVPFNNLRYIIDRIDDARYMVCPDCHSGDIEIVGHSYNTGTQYKTLTWHCRECELKWSRKVYVP